MLNIDSEFKSLIPPLTADEYEQLEQNLLRDGVRDPIVVWDETIIDGHNRYELAQKHGLAFNLANMTFCNRDAAKEWIVRNQFGRRNLSPYIRAQLALKLKPIISIKAKENKACGQGGVLLPQNSVEAKIDTQKELARIAGVSHDTIHKVEVIEAKAPEQVKSKIIEGDMSIHQAYNNIRREEKRAEMISELESIEAMEAKEIQGVYDVIVIDPPWPITKIERDVRPNQVEYDYPVMSLEEIQALSIPSADHCHLWLWTTQRFLPRAFELLDSWRFSYICTFVWHKPGGYQPIGLPQYNCEFVLYATKGIPKLIDTKALPTCFSAARGGHSVKPEEFYDMVRRVTAGRRIDMFGRRPIIGFDSWGKESSGNMSSPK